MLGNRVRFHFDDFAAFESVSRTGADTGLKLFDFGLVDLHRAGSDRDVIIFREDPSIKVRRHIITDVHFGEVLVVRHFVFGKTNAFLEGDRVVVVARFDRFRNTRVSAICANHHIDLKLLLFTDACAVGMVCVVQRVRTIAGGGQL